MVFVTDEDEEELGILVVGCYMKSSAILPALKRISQNAYFGIKSNPLVFTMQPTCTWQCPEFHFHPLDGAGGAPLHPLVEAEHHCTPGGAPLVHLQGLQHCIVPKPGNYQKCQNIRRLPFLKLYEGQRSKAKVKA